MTNIIKRLLDPTPACNFTPVSLKADWKLPKTPRTTRPDSAVDMKGLSLNDAQGGESDGIVTIDTFLEGGAKDAATECNGESTVTDLPFSLKLEKVLDGSLHLTVIIMGYIDQPFSWIQLEKVLMRLSESDSVTMYIISGGGSIAGGMCVVSAMKKCKARITTVGMGVIGSMGSAIWMYGDELIAMPMCEIMYHMSAGMSFGNSLAAKEDAENIVDYINSIFLRKAVELNIITPEEAEMINKNKQDVYITAEEYNARQGGSRDDQ